MGFTMSESYQNMEEGVPLVGEVAEERSEVSLFFSKNDKAVFDEIDTDHDKQISPKEFELVKNHPNDQARALAKSLKFEDMDINGNKFIDFDEFQTYIEASGNTDLHRFVRGDTEISTTLTSKH